MLNVDFINTGEIEYDEDSYRDKKDINNWMMTIKNLVKIFILMKCLMQKFVKFLWMMEKIGRFMHLLKELKK